jgi:hypothetical protein
MEILKDVEEAIKKQEVVLNKLIVLRDAIRNELTHVSIQRLGGDEGVPGSIRTGIAAGGAMVDLIHGGSFNGAEERTDRRGLLLPFPPLLSLSLAPELGWEDRARSDLLWKTKNKPAPMEISSIASLFLFLSFSSSLSLPLLPLPLPLFLSLTSL